MFRAPLSAGSRRALRWTALALLPFAVPGCSMPGTSEWMWIALIALLLFGGAKLPSLMRSMGAGITEFKKGLKDGERGGEGGTDSGEGGDDKKKELREGE